MDRIYDLIMFYSEKRNGTIEKTVAMLRNIHKASDNKEALRRGRCALSLLEEVAVRKDHVAKLKSFLYDVITNRIKVQPLM